MRSGALTPEELETLLEDAFVLRDLDAMAPLFENRAVLVAGRESREARGTPAIARTVALLWDRAEIYVAAPRRVIQLDDTALVVAARGINVVRRGHDGRWRFAISLLDSVVNLEQGNAMKESAPLGSTLDFSPVIGLVLEGAPPEHPETDAWRVTMTLAPGSGGPPLHIHPHQEETYRILSGELDVQVNGQWRTLAAGEQVTIPAGTPHTFRNRHTEAVRAVNVHAPALEFPRYMAILHALVHAGKVRALPPRNLQSAIYLSMLFTAHHRTLVSVEPSPRLMRLLAFVGARLGYALPGERA